MTRTGLTCGLTAPSAENRSLHVRAAPIGIEPCRRSVNVIMHRANFGEGSMRHAVLVLGATATAAWLGAGGSAAAAEKCFDKGALTYVACPSDAAPASTPSPLQPAPTTPAVTARVWTGCYVGAHVGAASDSDVDVEARNDTSPIDVDESVDTDDAVAGGQVGCLFQVGGGGLVVGVAGAGSRAFGGGAASGVANSLIGAEYGVDAEIDWLADARLTVGYALGDWQPYVTAGVGFAGYEGSGVINELGSVAAFSVEETAVGPVVGLGVDYLLHDHWMIGVAGLYYFFDEETSTTFELGGVPTSATVSMDDVMVGRVRLGYKF